MIPYIPFFSQDRLNVFFHDIRSLLYVVMPILVIYMAAKLGGYLIIVIRDAFSRNREREDRYDDDYRHDDY